MPSCTEEVPDWPLCCETPPCMNGFLHRGLPVLLLVGGLATAISVTLTIDPHNATHLTVVALAFGCAFVMGVIACFISQASHYVCAEPGKLTYDRIHRSNTALCPNTAKATGTVLMLTADLIFLPAVIHVHPDVFQGTILGNISEILLLQPIRGSALCGWQFMTLFWLVVVLALLANVLGHCVALPVIFNPYHPEGASKRLQSLGTFVLGFVLVSVIPIANKLVTMIPCMEQRNPDGSFRELAMLMCTDETCNSSLHTTYTSIATFCLVIFGASWISANTNLKRIGTRDDEEHLGRLLVPRNDPLALSFLMLNRGVTVVLCGLRLPFEWIALPILAVDVTCILFMTRHRFSNVSVLRHFAIAVCALKLLTLGVAIAQAIARRSYGVDEYSVIFEIMAIAGHIAVLSLYASRHVKRFGLRWWDKAGETTDFSEIVSEVDFGV